MIQQMLLGSRTDTTLINVITTASLTTNLKLCLDSGDAASYTSGQKWLDRSGNGYDFFLGADGSATATDPTFTGNAGDLQAYWTSDGGDYFTYDTTNETWMQNLHKNNAAFTLLAVVYKAGDADTFRIVGTSAGTTGLLWGINNSESNELLVLNATATVLLVTAGGVHLDIGRYHLIALSLNEATGAGGGFFYANGGYNQVSSSDTFNSTYGSPAAGNATSTMEIGSLGSGVNVMPSGARIAAIAMWDTALSKANLDVICAALRGRFGI